MNRRLFLLSTGSSTLAASLLRAATGRQPTLMPRSAAAEGERWLATPGLADGGPLRSIKVGTPIPLADNGGDTWVAAWADDDNLYSPSNDTSGFHNAAHSNIAFNCISGNDPNHLSGATVNPMTAYGKGGEEGTDGCTWKSSGCTCLNGVLYWVVARHKYGEKSGDPHRRQTAQNGSIIMSPDHGRTWTRSARENYDHPMFPGRRFATPYFIEYGRPHVDADNAGQYIYALANNGFWDCGDDMILGRVLRSKMPALNGADWEYFTGGDGMRASAWSRNGQDAYPVVQQPGKLGMTGAVYLPAHRRYLMIGWYYPLGGGKMPGAATHTVWDFYESPHPWGEWTRIGSYNSSPQGFYSPEICPKFQTPGQVFALTAGNWTNPVVYRLHFVPIELSA